MVRIRFLKLMYFKKNLNYKKLIIYLFKLCNLKFKQNYEFNVCYLKYFNK